MPFTDLHSSMERLKGKVLDMARQLAKEFTFQYGEIKS